MSSKWLDLKSKEAVKVIMDWWRGLENDRGGRAQLRRAKTELDTVLCHSYRQLFHKLRVLGNVRSEHLAPAAAVLTHIRSDTPHLTMGQALAQPKKGGSSGKVSDLRFRRLISIQTREELCPALIRVVRMLDNAAPVARLAHDIYSWQAGRYGDAVRKRWAYDYYASAPDKDDPHKA